jgi:hypothetical protein
MGVKTNILVSLLTLAILREFLTHCSSFYQEHSLAEGFDIKDGSVSIKCPEVDPGKKYIVVCKSPQYSIGWVAQTHC